MKATAYLVEHGETKLDQQGRVHGKFDEPLAPEGRQQGIELGKRLRRLAAPPSHIYASDRKRAATTAKLAGHVARLPVTVTAELRPLDTGVFSGQPQELAARKLRPYFEDSERRIPGGERVADWRARHLTFMRRVAAEHAKRGERAAFVTHSNVIGSAQEEFTGRGSAAGEMARPPRPATPLKVRIPVQEK